MRKTMETGTASLDVQSERDHDVSLEDDLGDDGGDDLGLYLHEIGSVPLGWYSGHVVERRYGLSDESLAHWMTDEAKSFAVGL